MKWSNLKIGLCPKCDYRLRSKTEFHPLYANVKSEKLECENPDCGFRCGKARAMEITENLNSPRLSPSGGSEEENLGLLNNL